MNATNTMIDVEAQVIDGLSNLHTQIIDANQSAYDRFNSLLESVPKMPEMPHMASAESVKRSYEFAGKVLTAQRGFVEQMVSVWYPGASAGATKTKATAK
jgi:hypothetical protein